MSNRAKGELIVGDDEAESMDVKAKKGCSLKFQRETDSLQCRSVDKIHVEKVGMGSAELTKTIAPREI